MYHVNAQTGELQQQIALPAGTTYFFGEIALLQTANSITAVYMKNNVDLWSYAGLSGSWGISPHIEDNLLLIQNRYPSDVPSVIAIDWTTGKKLWQLDDQQIVSNIVVAQDILFALDSSARLLLIDANNGHHLDEIKFSLPSSQVTNDALYGEGFIGGSQILVKEDVVGIYFQDTDIFSIYRFRLPIEHP